MQTSMNQCQISGNQISINFRKCLRFPLKGMNTLAGVSKMFILPLIISVYQSFLSRPLSKRMETGHKKINQQYQPINTNRNWLPYLNGRLRKNKVKGNFIIDESLIPNEGCSWMKEFAPWGSKFSATKMCIKCQYRVISKRNNFFILRKGGISFHENLILANLKKLSISYLTESKCKRKFKVMNLTDAYKVFILYLASFVLNKCIKKKKYFCQFFHP